MDEVLEKISVTERTAVDVLEKVLVVEREEIEVLRAVEVNSEQHNLGELRDFRRHDKIRDFLPELVRPAFAWTHLNPEEALAPHQHATPSMIIICKGGGYLTGQRAQPLKEGDIVMVPPHCMHGFIGHRKTGMDALSIQFGEEGGIYENVDQPLVKFNCADDQTAWQKLLAHNRARLERFKQSRFFTLLTDGTLDDPEKKQCYMNSLNIWVVRNQLLLFTRQATCIDEKYEKVFLQHFNEEVEHDQLYEARSSNCSSQEDPVIEALASWFIHQMFIRDNLEKAAIVHLVIENASDHYHQLAKPILIADGAEAYFKAHEEDCAHAEMGLRLLQGESDLSYQRLIPVIDKAWDMITEMVDRVAYLVDHN